MLLVGCFVLATGLLILLVPKTVQTGNPVLGQMRRRTRPGATRAARPLTYAVGSRPWEENNPEAYSGTPFTTVSQVCPGLLQSNLRAGLLWAGLGVAIIVARWIVIRRTDRQAASAPTGTVGTYAIGRIDATPIASGCAAARRSSGRRVCQCRSSAGEAEGPSGARFTRLQSRSAW